MQNNKSILNHILPLTLLVIALISIWGYTIGHGNSIQLMPYLQYEHDETLFAKDFFIQNAIQNLPNERSFFIGILQPFAANPEWPVFILFVLTTYLLLYALLQIANSFIMDYRLSYLVLCILLFPLLYHTLGLNEIYFGELNSNYVADAFSAWAIVFVLRKKIWLSYSMMILATLMHPLAGFHTFLLITGAVVLLAIFTRNNKIIFSNYLWPVLTYCCTAGVYIVYLQIRLHDAEWDDASFFQAFFVFRNAHHYIPTAFSTLDWKILTPLYLLPLFVFYKRNKLLFTITALIIIGCVVYSFIVLNYHSPAVATGQWFKTTIWLELFGVISIVLLLQMLLQISNKTHFTTAGLIVFISGIAAWTFLKFPGIQKIKTDITYELPFYRKMTPELDIAIKAGAVTDKNALFITPCGIDELKYYGKRSSVVDYKALTHSKSFIKEWTIRFNDVYQINPLTSETISFAVLGEADGAYKTMQPEQVEMLKAKYGITHIIMFAEHKLPYQVIAQNNLYTVYAL